MTTVTNQIETFTSFLLLLGFCALVYYRWPANPAQHFYESAIYVGFGVLSMVVCQTVVPVIKSFLVNVCNYVLPVLLDWIFAVFEEWGNLWSLMDCHSMTTDIPEEQRFLSKHAQRKWWRIGIFRIIGVCVSCVFWILVTNFVPN